VNCTAAGFIDMHQARWPAKTNNVFQIAESRKNAVTRNGLHRRHRANSRGTINQVPRRRLIIQQVAIDSTGGRPYRP